MGAGKKNGADSSAPQSSEGEREGVIALELAPTGGVRLSGTEGARAWAGLSGLVWAELDFSFFWNFFCLFYLFSLGFSIQIQIKFQIPTKSNMCNNPKNI